jgi:hypothetical protein
MEVSKEMLNDPIKVSTKDHNLDFQSAKKLADEIAEGYANEPILISWYDSRKGRFSPDVTCCSEEKPGWLVYAESRGGNIIIDVNDEQYIFVYGDMSLE